MNTLRVLLVGAGGQVGRALRRTLRPACDLRAFERDDLDIRDEPRVREAVSAAAPDLVVNAAAYTDVDGAESDAATALAVNATAPGVLADAARTVGAALLHYSTDYVFDGAGETPWPEDAPTGPLNVYGRSKLAGEEAIRAAGVDHLIVRTAWVYGVGGRNFVETMLRLGAERETLAVVDDQFGAPTTARAIADVTAGIVAASAADLAGRFRDAGGVVHLTCRGATSWHGFAEEIFRQAGGHGVPLRVRKVEAIGSAEFAAPAPRPRNSRLDCRRLTERFGLQPPHWKDALARYLEDRATPESS